MRFISLYVMKWLSRDVPVAVFLFEGLFRLWLCFLTVFLWVWNFWWFCVLVYSSICGLVFIMHVHMYECEYSVILVVYLGGVLNVTSILQHLQ